MLIYKKINYFLTFLLIFSAWTIQAQVLSENAIVGDWSEGNKKFTAEFYPYAKSKQTNFIFSPLSLQMALSMTTELTYGETQEELINVGRLPSYAQNRQDAAKHIIDLFNKGNPSNQETLALSLANGAWISSASIFRQNLIDIFTNSYKGILSAADFRHSSSYVRDEINQWVEENTQSKIKEFLPEGSVSSDTQLVLVNTLYMKAPWQDAFDPSKTYEDIFYGLDNPIQDISYMQMKKKFRVLEKDKYSAIEIPFIEKFSDNQNLDLPNAHLSLFVILPRLGISLTEIEKSMDAQLLNECINEAELKQVTLHLPKFKVSTLINAKPVLKKMGLNHCFSGKAQFELEGNDNLIISDIFHKAVFEVDEKGGVGAAATGIVMNKTFCQNREEIVINRPFIVIVAEKTSGLILFAGRILNPNK